MWVIDRTGPRPSNPSSPNPPPTSARRPQTGPPPTKPKTTSGYGTREGQAITFVPLDARLQLPVSDYSYLLQEWVQILGCEAAFARVGATRSDIPGLYPSTDTLERMNRQMAAAVRPFRETRSVPDPADEGAVVAAQADGQGVVIRRPADDPPILGHRTEGQRANRKRMAIVGAVDAVGRAVRTPADVVASLFRDPAADRPARVARPDPVGKHVWAILTHDRDGVGIAGTDEVFPWLSRELARRDPEAQRETVDLMGGQESLWAARRKYRPGQKAVEIPDLLHVTPRVWAAAHVFHREGSPAAVAFVRDRPTQVSNGRVATVVGGLRPMGTKRGLTGGRGSDWRWRAGTWPRTPRGCGTTSTWRGGTRSPAG